MHAASEDMTYPGMGWVPGLLGQLLDLIDHLSHTLRLGLSSCCLRCHLAEIQLQCVGKLLFQRKLHKHTRE